MNWCMRKPKTCVHSFLKMLSEGEAPDYVKGIFLVWKMAKSSCLPKELPWSPALVYQRPMCATSWKGWEVLCGRRATGALVSTCWGPAESGQVRGKPPARVRVMESCWHLIALPVASAKRAGRRFGPCGPISTSQLALIGPLAGSRGREAGDWQGVCTPAGSWSARVPRPGHGRTEATSAAEPRLTQRALQPAPVRGGGARSYKHAGVRFLEIRHWELGKGCL
jgi:hypothetical protein